MTRKTESADRDGLPQRVDEDLVVAYLADHPDLLVRRPELLAKLIPPSRFDGDSVVDLQKVMIRRLTEELEQMKGCAEHLIATSRSNMSIQSRTHQVVMSMLAAGDLENLLRVVAEDMPAQLDLDIALLAFETEGGDVPPGLVAMSPGSVEAALGTGDVLLRSQRSADPTIFGDAATLINSFALARVAPKIDESPIGMLALGSRHDRTFHSSQGTELLAFLASVLEDCISRWWPVSP
ncbi:MAG TPA: DUF484 family protein [Magnetospirillaceae bacterium]|nr:DUF484 family protein [Magnetospirillaceae bacterium]